MALDKLQPGRKCRVVDPYRTAYPDPLVVREGEELRIIDRESAWNGWAWCTNREGKSGWVPDAYLDREGDRGIASQDYDATELTVEPGDELVVLKEESGWILCANPRGDVGWVPLENVEVT